MSLLTGYSIFVVIGMLPACEANQILSLVRVEPPRPSPSSSSSAHTSTTYSKSQPMEQPRSSSQSEERWWNKGKKRRRSPEHEEGKREEQDLQMAMAMSVSLETSQERYEIDQQLQLHELQGAEGKDPSFNANDDMEEEEEVALTAAIYASLG